jgi:hypothetical protein
LQGVEWQGIFSDSTSTSALHVWSKDMQAFFMDSLSQARPMTCRMPWNEETLRQIMSEIIHLFAMTHE